MNAHTEQSTTGLPASNTDHARGMVRAGGWIILAAIVPVCAWVALAPLSMAVVAPAVVKVDLNRRPVQHLEGGIVRSVMVRDGQRVNAGEPILVLGDVGVDADRNRLDYRVHVALASIARLEAEQALARALVFPAPLLAAAAGDERLRETMAKERSVFDTRRHALASEVALLRLQGERIDQEMQSLRAQIEQARISLDLQRENLAANQALLKDGFVSSTRIAQIAASVADYASRLEQQRSELARAGQRKVDAELRIRTIQNQYAQAASDQLNAMTTQLSEIEQELRKSEDAATRQLVVAPTNGEVIELKFTSPGAVVRPGESIAEIVPSDAGLLIEARIRPEDVNNVQRGQTARIKFTSFKYRNTTMVSGQVSYISADRLTDPASGLPYYAVNIIAEPDSLRSVGELRLQAGMPAEVYIEGQKQTALQYLAEPITSTLRRAGRQM